MTGAYLEYLASKFPFLHTMKPSIGHHFVSEVQSGDLDIAILTEKCKITKHKCVCAASLLASALLASSLSLHADCIVRTGPHLHKDTDEKKENVLNCKKFIPHAQNMRKGGE